VRSDIDVAIAALAARRAGAFSLAEVGDLGGDRWLARRRVEAGRWQPRPGGTFVLAGHPPSLAQARHLALLAAGPAAALSHECAAELHRLDGIRRGLVVVTLPHTRRLLHLPDVAIHRIDDLVDLDVTVVDGARTTTPTRTVIDLAAVVGDVRLQRAIESAIVGRQTRFTDLAATLRRVRRQGKTGVTRLVRVLDRLDGEAPPASELERHLTKVMRRAGLRGVRQYPLPWDAEPIDGCVDVAVEASRLIVESDGRSWHARLDAMAKDRRRDRMALRAGWETLRFVHKDLVDDPAGAADDIKVVHQRRLAE
jgi:very-short-patch-repair endonuclease